MQALDQMSEFKRLCSVDGVSRVYREKQRGSEVNCVNNALIVCGLYLLRDGT